MILTPRLRLRALTRRDLTLFRALYCDAGTMRHIGKPLSRGPASASLRATVAAMRKSRRLKFYAIIERSSRRAIGLCSLRPAAWDAHGAELGIMLVRAARGRSYAREALQTLIADAFLQLPIDAVWAQYRQANSRSGYLFDALGFHRPAVGTKRGECVRMLPRPRGRGLSHQPTRGVTMSNIIGFLEQAGRNAVMRHASREALLRAMHEEKVAPMYQHALLHAQRSVLDDLTGARETMYCKNTSIKPPKKKPAKKASAKKPAKKAPAKRKK